MIHDVDESLRALIRKDVLNGSGVEIAFDAPTKDWAARRNQPTLDVYLYQIQEDVKQREVSYVSVRDDTGRVTERRPPARRFKLSYMLTAWTQRPEDEHRLLSAALGCLIRYDQLPKEMLAGALADQPDPVTLSIGLPLPPDRSLNDVWSALGGELKPALDLVVAAPFVTGRVEAAGPPVLEEPRIRIAQEAGGKKRTRPVQSPAASPWEIGDPVAAEAVTAGSTETPGRTVRVRELPRPAG
jgi:hypothetical protein